MGPTGNRRRCACSSRKACGFTASLVYFAAGPSWRKAVLSAVAAAGLTWAAVVNVGEMLGFFD